LLEHAGHLGLFAAEIDANDGTALENYPQAFPRAALINGVYNLRKAELCLSTHYTSPVIAAFNANA
jgi:GH15 family glucan-1,4-alpha-glucosidase